MTPYEQALARDSLSSFSYSSEPVRGRCSVDLPPLHSTRPASLSRRVSRTNNEIRSRLVRARNVRRHGDSVNRLRFARYSSSEVRVAIANVRGEQLADHQRVRKEQRARFLISATPLSSMRVSKPTRKDHLFTTNTVAYLLYLIAIPVCSRNVRIHFLALVRFLIIDE